MGMLTMVTPLLTDHVILRMRNAEKSLNNGEAHE